jgi:hypothetical protein
VERDAVRAVIDALVAKFEGDFSPPIERWGNQYPESERHPPERADWAALETKFCCTFEDSFVHFMTLMPNYNCPGTLEVRRDRPSHYLDEQRIDQVWDHEMAFGGWDPAMIPFNSFSNGDFYCLKGSPDGRSEVWFHDHEDQSDEKVADNFADFLSRLEWNLNGTE